MQHTTKIASLFMALAIFATPAAAFTNISDSVLMSWPTGMTEMKKDKVDKMQFGTTRTLKSFKPVVRPDSKKKK